MSEQNNQESHPPQPTKDNRADYFKDIADFARAEIKFVRSAYKWLISLVAIVAIVGISVGIWFTHKSSSDLKQEWREEVERLGRQVNIRIDEEFRKENIHKMVQEKARERIDKIADVLIEKQIADKISPQIKSAEEQLEKLKQRNEIGQLGDRGISEASRDSLEELERIREKGESANIRAAADAEIARIKGFWASRITRLGSYLPKAGEKTNESALTTNKLIEMLTNNDWKMRALVAQELGNRKEKGVPEALLQCMKTDQDLEVVRDSIRSFARVTGFISPDVFGYRKAQNWWNEHSAEVNAKLAIPK